MFDCNNWQLPAALEISYSARNIYVQLPRQRFHHIYVYLCWFYKCRSSEIIEIIMCISARSDFLKFRGGSVKRARIAMNSNFKL